MSFSIKLEKTIKAPVAILVAGAFLFSGTVFSQEKPSIKKLTSKDKAKEIAKKVDQKPEPRIPGELKKHSFGIGLGQTFVKGDFKDNGEDKITFDLLYNYSASHSFDLLVDAHIHKHSFRGRYAQLTGAAVGIKAKLYQFDAFAPYVIGGLGFYAPKVKRYVNNVLLESESKVVFGTHLGAGGELRLNSKYAVGILGHYHNPFDVKQETGPEVEGSYFKLLITLLYTL